jgi:hypothetical protein
MGEHKSIGQVAYEHFQVAYVGNAETVRFRECGTHLQLCWEACAEGVKTSLAGENHPPIPMRLTCPHCAELHIDEGEFATTPHHTHACQCCGAVWRPAVVHTVGVRFLPGFKNEEASRG